MGPHASHICMHAMLAYGDIDLMLAMNAETATNSADADADISADIVINSRTDIRDRLHHLPAGRRTPACTAGRISTPPEVWSGVGWSGGSARTAAGVAGKRRSARGAGSDGVGQLMLMLLGKEGELMISCWICKKLF